MATQTLTGVQKVAVLLLSIDQELAASVLRSFPSEHLEKVARAMKGLRDVAIDQSAVDQLRREGLDRFRSGGGTIVLSSHVMDLVERLCDHIGVIHRGQLVATGPTETLRNGRRLEDAFIDVIGESTVDDQALAWLT